MDRDIRALQRAVWHCGFGLKQEKEANEHTDQLMTAKKHTDYLMVTQMVSVDFEIGEGILEFFGHTARRGNDKLEKLLITGKVEGKRPRGRSPIRWTDQIRTTLKTTVHDALHSAADRNRWRRVIRSTLLPRGGHDPQH
ncbi:unnamed protein product [Spodoptera exigua]|nr:unnamed protein product [Spodoptera exigua]